MLLTKCAAPFLALVLAFTLFAQGSRANPAGNTARPAGPCDVYAAAGDPCVAAHSTTRALFRAYHGALYQVLRQSDGKTLDIAVVEPGAAPAHDGGGYANAAAQDAFCRDTYCWISKIYDQSSKHNDLLQAPRGGFSGPAMGGQNNLPLADMAPVSVMGHKVYGVFIAPGMGLRIDDPRGTAVDDQAEGQYWVINGLHFNSGCCFDYGNAEIDSRDDDNGTMETAYFGDSSGWIHGNMPGPWIETDQENNLVGCIPPPGSHLCENLPDIHWRFVTAMAKGEPHHWTSMGADSQHGPLQVMFSGQRVNSSYDPMRKQGAILLGNGGDNSNSSQGTFYEGAVTATGTFPADATDQAVQANVVGAQYRVLPLSIRPASARRTLGVQTFAPGMSHDLAVAFTNVSEAPAQSVTLTLAVPPGWSAVAQGNGGQAGGGRSATFATVAPGATVSAKFTVSAGSTPFDGDAVGHASWTDNAGKPHTETLAQKVRSAAPVKINEFRITSGAAGNTTDSFIELYNAGTSPVDLSRWTLTARPAQQPSSSSVQIPAGTQLQPKGFYLLGLANSALASAAGAGDTVLAVRSTTGMSVGDVVHVGTGTDAEDRTIAAIGTPAADPTTLWQPLPDGPITLAPGATDIPVESVAGFKVGDRIALGYGSASQGSAAPDAAPFIGKGTEQYETATVTAVGKPGLQAYLAVDAPAGATVLQVTSAADISVGDAIRLDIDSQGHGIETVHVARVGTEAQKTNLAADVPAGASSIRVRRAAGIHSGDRILVGTPASKEEVTVSAVRGGGPNGAEITLSTPLSRPHGLDEWVVAPGSGIGLAAPLRFAHASNLPFSDRGTGIRFTPATRFAHTSDEPVVALGSGITLDRPLAHAHPLHAAVRDDRVTTAGYQGTQKPDQWFGGPELVTRSLSFGRVVTVREASMVLRDAKGMVVDSLNYGALVDPWIAKGDQAESGPQSGGCFAASPDPGYNFGPAGGVNAVNRSAGRFPDGADTGSDCTDFRVQSATVLPMGATAGSATLQVTSVAGFHAGQSVMVGMEPSSERVTIQTVGTAGATLTTAPSEAGGTALLVQSPAGFQPGQAVTIGKDANAETATVASIHRPEGHFQVVFNAPLRSAHPAGTPVSGTGLTLASALTASHAAGSAVATDAPTPGRANRYEQAASAPGGPER